MKKTMILLLLALSFSFPAQARERWKDVVITGAVITAAAAVIVAVQDSNNDTVVAANPNYPNTPVSVPGTGRPDPRCPSSMPYYSPDWGCLTMPR